MEIKEAIEYRRCIRAFRPEPVPRKVLEELLQTCLRSPSWGNTQPWEFAIIGGRVIAELRQRLVARLESGEKGSPDITYPFFPDPYTQRYRANGRQLFEIVGIPRDDREKRALWSKRMYRFFDAPNGIILYMDRALGPYSMLDMGIFLQTLMLAALGYGLGTCPEAAVVTYPGDLRKVLGIPDTKQIVCGLAIGYPDPDAPVNGFRTGREPLDTLATWHGIDT